MNEANQNISVAIEDLRNKIRHHDVLYYEKAAPEISDREYDELMSQLVKLESQHPELVTPDSPTHRVGGEPLDKFEPYTHTVRMMSIDNTYSESEVRDFDLRVRKALGGQHVVYTCEHKIDGVSLSLRYEGGVLSTAATRGNGRIGDNVTRNARTIRCVPLKLKPPEFFGDITSSAIPAVIEVRGEVYLSRKQFVKINEEQKKRGLEQYANPRNTAAGTLKLLDSRIVALRKLDFLPHGFGQVEGVSFEAYSQLLDYLVQLGFCRPAYFKFDNIEGVISYIHKFAVQRPGLVYDTDGVVIKVDNFAQRRQLGETDKSPRWCIAYKYEPERGQTQLTNIVFQVGKTGTITPVAEFSPPLSLSGTQVYRASLHNFDEIARKDIQKFDWVLVEKAGEVIPYVVGVVKEKRPANAEIIGRPTSCPECHSTILEHEGGFVRCRNPLCPAQLKEHLVYFCGRNQMDIAEIGPAVIDSLVDANILKAIPDLFQLTADELEPITISVYEKKKDEAAPSIPNDQKQNETELFPDSTTPTRVRIGPVRARKIVDSIASAKGRGLGSVLAGLGLPNIGVVTAHQIAQSFNNITHLVDARIADFLALPDMGKGVLNAITGLRKKHDFLQSLSDEQLLGLTSIPVEILNRLQSTYVSARGGKTLADKLNELRKQGVAARSLFEFLHSDAGRKVIGELSDHHVNLQEPKLVKVSHQPFAGMTIVVTGTLQKFSRSEIKKEIEGLGGKTSESVSKKTSFVVAGDEAGSKLDKARDLKVEVIDEAEFLKRAQKKD